MYRIDPIVCNNKQKWNRDNCRCECLINKKGCNKFVWNPSNCKCEYKKAAHLLTTKYEEIIDNKTASIKKYNKNTCKSLAASSNLFLSVSVAIAGTFIYFYVNLQSAKDY